MKRKTTKALSLLLNRVKIRNEGMPSTVILDEAVAVCKAFVKDNEVKVVKQTKSKE
jgi:transcription termination factor NusB